MEKKVHVEVADPTVLGLFGLAIVTLIASSQKLGFTDGLAFILPWGIFLGGICQLIAAIFDFKLNNLFGATAFSAYGLFWLGTALSWSIKLGAFGDSIASNADVKQLGFVFIAYLLLTIILTISSIKMPKSMFVLLVIICFLFVGLACEAFGFGLIWHTIAGVTELVISLLTFYVLSGKYLNSIFGKEVLPLGKPLYTK